jgi:hypothetical protein
MTRETVALETPASLATWRMFRGIGSEGLPKLAFYSRLDGFGKSSHNIASVARLHQGQLMLRPFEDSSSRIESIICITCAIYRFALRPSAIPQKKSLTTFSKEEYCALRIA